MPTITHLTGQEILDSRGRPTVQATCTLASGTTGSASVPSGASTGKAEALELRDGEGGRYGGLGCRRAVANIEGPIRERLVGSNWPALPELERAMQELDGTINKSRLGANALLAVSLAFCRAVALERRWPLYRYFGELAGHTAPRLPRPTINLFSGGKHAGGQVGIQDVLVVPKSARSMDEALALTYAVYQSAAQLTARRYQARLLVADEGGLAPAFTQSEEMLSAAVDSITAAGLHPGRDVSLAVDLAASHFYRKGRYHLDGQERDGRAMIELIEAWVKRYPVVSVEDALAEDDWAHWPHLRAQLQGHALVLGDDLLCTQAERVRRAILLKAADALLLKVNQVGSLMEALEALRLARNAGWHVTVSARSGETEDHWLADLAVGWGADHIKIGSITRSERLAKYNRLLAIEREAGLDMAP